MTRKLLFAAFLGLGIISTGCDNAASKIKNDVNTGAETSEAGFNANAGAEQNLNVNSNGALPDFKFEEENHNFGTIEEGTLAKYDFVFTNTGDAPLIITNASGSCGCTVPQWPREPIAPGEEGIIHVEFNSNNRTGNQTKTVTLDANTVPNKKVLRISAMVNPDPNKKEEQAEVK
jgi:hypothetical protein